MRSPVAAAVCVGLTLIAGTGAAPSDLYTYFKQQANATLGTLKSVDSYPGVGACPGCYDWADTGPNSWVASFFISSLLLLYNQSVTAGSGDAGWWLSQAQERSQGILIDVNFTGTHDIGFMVFYSFGRTYEVTGNMTAFAVTVQTAHTLAKRFSPVVGCIESWGPYPLPKSGNFLVIIDNMMNLELLWWAAQVTGNTTLFDIAQSHADKMLADVFQPFNPGCVWHMVTYDAATGGVKNQSSTPQGLGKDTVWARGQGWAIYGYITAYRYSQLPRYLEAAQLAADCFIRLNEASPYADSYVPLWDFNATKPEQYGRDTSSSAITASALIEIAWYTTNPQLQAGYLSAAKRILTALTTPPFSNIGNPSLSPAFIANGTVTFPQTGIPTVYGDYYTLEAVGRWEQTPAAMKAGL